MRAIRLASAATMLFSVAVVFAPATAVAATAPAAPEDTAARRAILESTAAHPDPAVIPADFEAEFGYRPVLESGLLVNPRGDCSSPVPLPAEFDLACKAHDFGYDLLRYADAHNQPLGPWARQTLDAGLEQRMHASCATRPTTYTRTQCQVMAGIATTAVDLNSIRQNYGVPVHEAMFDDTSDTVPAPLRIAGFALAATGSLALLLLLIRTARARRVDLTVPAVA
ncbi:hypothetical protein [Nocardia sp. NPDC127526]|uniref:hypothetical protein n=1 Tax=Nocardia sp. NPDC127526 TaxID=3345393 RepID=UPI00362A2430